MINKFEIENFGPIKSARIDNLGRINLVLGENSVGKTFLLKTLYSVHKTAEEYGKGDDISRVKDILAHKLRWTFQADALGELIHSGENNCSISIEDDSGQFNLKFGKKATIAINDVENNMGQIGYNSVFIPAREVFSIQKIILRSRDIDRVFGFDDSQYDVAKALELTPSTTDYSISDSQSKLLDLMGGQIVLDKNSNKWQYIKDGISFTVGTASDGIRKLGMLEKLLENGYISNDSIIFIDEIEAGLHPTAIIRLLQIIGDLVSHSKMQFFISSHSYFVVKKLYLMTLKSRREDIKCIMPGINGYTVQSFLEGMPKNPIIEESVRLYEEEINEVI